MQYLSPENSERLRLQVDSEFTCQHTRSGLTLQLRKGDKRFYRTQCFDCGYIVKEWRRVALSEEQIAGAVPYDDSLTPAFWRRRIERSTELQKQLLEVQQHEFGQRYAAYLSSDQWKRIRGLVLQRDEYLCQGCRVNRAVDVHHLTYERLYDEMLFDLIAVCRDCHERLHPEHSAPVEAAPFPRLTGPQFQLP